MMGSTTAAEATSSSQTSTSSDPVHSDEEEDGSVPEFEERKLTMSTPFTVDEGLCLKYFLIDEDVPQPQPRGKRVNSRQRTYPPSSKTQNRCIAY